MVIKYYQKKTNNVSFFNHCSHYMKLPLYWEKTLSEGTKNVCFIVAAMISKCINVYISAILRALTWLDCVFFPWVKGTESVPLQWASVYAHSGALSGTLRCECVRVCVRVCGCIYVHYDGYCSCLISILNRGVDSTVVLKLSFACVWNLTHLYMYLGPLKLTFIKSSN